MIKYSEKILETASSEEKEKCKTLFIDLFHKKSGVDSVVIFDSDWAKPTKVLMYCKIITPIDNDTYKNFIELFEFLEKINLNFSLKDNDLKITITNIDEFIIELEILANTKKYNV